MEEIDIRINAGEISVSSDFRAYALEEARSLQEWLQHDEKYGHTLVEAKHKLGDVQDLAQKYHHVIWCWLSGPDITSCHLSERPVFHLCI